MKSVITFFLILFSTIASGQVHPNPIVQSIVDWHRQYCYDNLTDLRNEDYVPSDSDFGVDEGSIYDIEIADNQTATVIYKSFTCRGEGHGWCGSGGCGYFIVVNDKIFQRKVGFKPRMVSIPTYVGTRPALVIPLHGTACEGGAGSDTCFAMATWNEKMLTFQSMTELLSAVQLSQGDWIEIDRP